jgi:acyl dehydratase
VSGSGTAAAPTSPAAPSPPEPLDGPPSAVWRVPGDTGRRYAAVSGDVNPIHLHPLAARAFGFPRAVAHGMWTAARAAAALQGRLPDAVTYAVTFARPLLLPGRVELRTRRAGDGWALDIRGRTGPHLTATLRA